MVLKFKPYLNFAEKQNLALLRLAPTMNIGRTEQFLGLNPAKFHNNINAANGRIHHSVRLNESSTKLLPKDTVLMAMYGVTAGEIGYLAIEATTNQAICGMICNSKANAAYLYFSLIQSQTAISRLSNGGAQDNLSKNFIDNIKIVVPPSEFIEKMKLAAIVEQMTLNTKEIAILEELQATALAQLSSY